MKKKYPLIGGGKGQTSKGMLDLYCAESNKDKLQVRFKCDMDLLKRDGDLEFVSTNNGDRPLLDVSVFRSCATDVDKDWDNPAYLTELSPSEIWNYFEDVGDKEFGVRYMIKIAYVSQKTISYRVVGIVILDNSDLNRTYMTIDRNNTVDKGPQRIAMGNPDEESDDEGDTAAPKETTDEPPAKKQMVSKPNNDAMHALLAAQESDDDE